MPRSNPTALAAVLLVTVLIGWLAHLAAPVLTPLVVAAGLAQTARPLVDRLSARLPHRLAAVLAALVVGFLLLWMALVGWPLAVEQATLLLSALAEAPPALPGRLLPGAEEAVSGQFGRLGPATLWLLGWTLLVPAVLYGLLRAGPALSHALLAWLPLRWRGTALRGSHRLQAALASLIPRLLARLLLYSLGTAWIGLDFWWALALLATLASLLPGLGLLVGLLAAGLLPGGDVTLMLGLVLIFVAVEALVGWLSWRRPSGLHPLLVVVALLLGGAWLGALGLALALPAAAAATLLGPARRQGGAVTLPSAEADPAPDAVEESMRQEDA